MKICNKWTYCAEFTIFLLGSGHWLIIFWRKRFSNHFEGSYGTNSSIVYMLVLQFISPSAVNKVISHCFKVGICLIFSFVVLLLHHCGRSSSRRHQKSKQVIVCISMFILSIDSGEWLSHFSRWSLTIIWTNDFRLQTLNYFVCVCEAGLFDIFIIGVRIYGLTYLWFAIILVQFYWFFFSSQNRNKMHRTHIQPVENSKLVLM